MSWRGMTGKHVEVIPQGGTPGRSWLRHFLTSRKVAVSISDSVTGNFHWYNPSGITMTTGSTQSLKEVSTRQPVPRADNLAAFMFRLSWNRGSQSPVNLWDCTRIFFYVLLTVHLSIILVINQPVHRKATYSCDDTRCCIIQFWPHDDEHIVLETCRGI